MDYYTFLRLFIDSLINYKSLMADISNICENESYDDIVITGDMTADPKKGRFFKEYSKYGESRHVCDTSS